MMNRGRRCAAKIAARRAAGRNLRKGRRVSATRVVD